MALLGLSGSSRVPCSLTTWKVITATVPSVRGEKHKGLEWDKVSVWWLSRSSELHQIHGAVPAEPLSEFDGYPGKQIGKSLSCTVALIKRCQPDLLVCHHDWQHLKEGAICWLSTNRHEGCLRLYFSCALNSDHLWLHHQGLWASHPSACRQDSSMALVVDG